MSADIVNLDDARTARDQRRALTALLAFALLFALAWAGRGE